MKKEVSSVAVFLSRFSCSLFLTLLMVNAPSARSDGNSIQSLREIFDIQTPQDRRDVDEEFRKRSEDKSLVKEPQEQIPSAVDRNQGPRIVVNQFVIDNARDFSELKIFTHELNEIAEELRLKYMRSDERGAGGYTQKELKEITHYLNNIGSNVKPENLTYEDFQALLDVVREHKQNKGLSFSEIENVASQLTDYLRNRGLMLAQVILPAQEVTGGIVHLQVLEGILSEVSTLNNQKYSDKRLTSPFAKQLGKAVEKEKIEENIYLLNDLPGLNIMGIFGAGEQIGETRLNLTVRDEDNFAFLFRVDNHGSKLTGSTRFYSNIRWFNPIGIGDEFSLGYLRSEEFGSNNADKNMPGVFPKKPQAHTDLGQISYSLPIFGLRNRLTLAADRSEFDVVDEQGGLINALELSGINTQYSIGLQHQLQRQLNFNTSLGLTFTDKTSETDSFANILSKKDHAQGGEIRFYIDGLSEGRLRMLNTASFTVQYGNLKTPVKAGQDSEFIKGTIDTGSLFFIPELFGKSYTRLIVNTKTQYSDSALPSFEQFSLGGANGVRAFKVGDFSTDKAFFINNEWYLNLPDWQVTRIKKLNDIIQLGLLLDYAYGTKNGGYITESGYQQEDEWAWMSAAGIVLKTSWGKHYSGKLTLAQPIDAKSSNDPKNKNSTVKPLNSKPHAITVYADFNFLF